LDFIGDMLAEGFHKNKDCDSLSSNVLPREMGLAEGFHKNKDA
jgi:hypothetical protein